MELQKFLTQKYPSVFPSPERITWSIFPPPWWAVQVSQLTQLLQLAGMAYIFLGDAMLSLPPIKFVFPPDGEAATWAREHKVQLFIGLFFINSFASQFSQTGAFEVTFEGKQIFSKLKSGRMPTGPDIMDAMDQALGNRLIK